MLYWEDKIEPEKGVVDWEYLIGREYLVSEIFEEISIEDDWGNIGGDKVDWIILLIKLIENNLIICPPIQVASTITEYFEYLGIYISDIAS